MFNATNDIRCGTLESVFLHTVEVLNLFRFGLLVPPMDMLLMAVLFEAPKSAPGTMFSVLDAQAAAAAAVEAGSGEVVVDADAVAVALFDMAAVGAERSL